MNGLALWTLGIVLAITQLINLTYFEGLSSDFSDLALQVVSANASYNAPYSVVDKADGEWIVVNATIPDGGGYSLNILSSTESGGAYDETGDPSIIEVPYQEGFAQDFGNLIVGFVSPDGTVTPVTHSMVGMSEGQWAIIALPRPPMAGETISLMAKVGDMQPTSETTFSSEDAIVEDGFVQNETKPPDKPLPETTDSANDTADSSTESASMRFFDASGNEHKAEGKKGKNNRMNFKLEGLAVREITFIGLDTPNSSLGLDFPTDVPAPDGRTWEQVYAIDPTALDFTSASVTVTAQGNALYKCKDWDFASRSCGGEWVLMRSDLVPGEDYAITITPEDPAFGEANITVIDVQSYPVVGGDWTVRFTTTGTANLSIRAVMGTTWDDLDPDADLNFIELRCGDITLSPVWDDASKTVLYENYFCSDTGYETSRVLTSGAHHLEFQFGDDIDYANNDAGDLVVTNIAITGSGPDDNLVVSYYINSTSADTGIVDWRRNGTSIAVLNYPFDMNVSSVSSALIKDYSNRQINATLGGGTAGYTPTWYSSSSCVSGGCYQFDSSDDRIEITTPQHGITNNFTIECWIYPTVSASYRAIASFGSYTPALYLNSGYLNLYGAGGSSTNTVTLNVWHHVAVTRNSDSTVTYYIDGNPNGTTTYGSNVDTGTFRIGYSGFSGEVFGGRIDEFRLYNRSLSAAQILAIYNSGVPSHNVTARNETELNDQWSACVTSSNSSMDGQTNCSTNVTISLGTPVGSCQAINASGIYQLSANLQGKNGANSECILINASGVSLNCQGFSIIDNESGTTYGILINNSITGFILQNCPNISGYTEGIRLADTGNHSFSGIGLYGNDYGIYSNNSNESSFTGMTMRGNGIGALFESSNRNNITESSSGFSTYDGIRLVTSSANKIDPSYYCNNTGNGITVNLSDDTLIDDSVACNNTGIGIEVTDSNNVTVMNTRLFNNSLDFKEGNALGSPVSLRMPNVTFDRPAGDLVNYTRISLNDTAAAGSSYSMNWSAAPDAIPAGNVSIGGKFMNITALGGTVSLDRLALHWLDSEVSQYNESTFSFFEYNSSGWVLLNDSPDVGLNEISYSSLIPHSVYGILAGNGSVGASCVNLSDNTTFGGKVVNLSGVYYVNNDTLLCTGTYLTNLSMIVMNSSGITLDCNGANLSGDGGTDTDYGIQINNPDFVTVKNCIVDNFYHDIYVYGTTDNATIDNNTLTNMYQDGINLVASGCNITNNVVVEPAAAIGDDGIYVSGGYNLLSGNIVSADNECFYIGTGSYNILVNNSADSGTDYGFRISSALNNLTNNTANNGYYGFYVTANQNTFANNNASNNSYYGFYITSNLNLFTNNTANRNTYSGFYVSGGDSNNFTDNTAYGNTYYGFEIYSSANSNIMRNNLVYGNSYGSATYAGYNIYSSTGNRIENDTIYGNGQYGIYLYAPTGNNISDTHVFNHTYDAYIQYSASGQGVYFRNLTIDNPSGSMENYTSFDLFDNTTAAATYYIDWAGSPATLPSERISFRGKFVNITNTTGAVEINSINWTWADDEVTSEYTEAYFELWKNSGTWSMLNYTLIPAQNTISMTNMSPQSVFGILDWNVTHVSGCMEITVPGTAHLTANLDGANISDSNYPGLSCVKIATSDLVLDCLGYGIANNGTAGTTAGILVNSTSSSPYTNITIQNCPGVSGYGAGAYLPYAQASVQNSTFKSNDYNVNASSQNMSLANVSLFNATVNDLHYSNDAGSDTSLNLANVLFLRPAGDLANFTNLSLFDSAASGSSYYLNWSSEPIPDGLPVSYVSVLGRFVDIAPISGAVSLDSVTWHWTQAEISGYDELLFELWKHNASNWTMQNDTPNTGANHLRLFNHDPASTYALLENQGVNNVTGCMEITSGGIYQLQNGLSGANISDPAYPGLSCIKIASGDVLFDCADYPIANNGTAGTTYGVLVNGSASASYDNIILRNCVVSDFSYGQYLGYAAVEGRNSSLHGNIHNAYLNNSNATLSDYRYYGAGTDDLGVYSAPSLALAGNLFLNPSGTYQNYTNLSLSDAAASEAYAFAWAIQPDTPPQYHSSFGGKYLNITNMSGAASIDSANWTWLDSEIGSSNESRLVLFKHNSSGWMPQNSTPDTGNNTLSVYGHDIGSTYGILENTTLMNCPIINASGTYVMGADFSGAPNNYYSTYYGCVIINASNVLFDCNGYRINHTQTANTHGIASIITVQNVTVRNCNINGFAYSMYLPNLQNSKYQYNNLTNFTSGGMFLGSYSNISGNNVSSTGGGADGISYGGSYNNVSNNTIRVPDYPILNDGGDYSRIFDNNITSGTYGIYLESTSVYNNITNNSVSNNTYCIYFYDGISYSRVIGNNLSNCSNTGIYISYNSDNNLIANNSVYNATTYCLYVYVSSASTTYYCDFNNITNNTFSRCTYGVYLRFPRWTTLANNTIANTTYGVYNYDALNTSMGGDRIFNSSNVPLYVQTLATTAKNISLANVIFDNPYGNYSNFTNISMFDVIPASTTYWFNWTQNSSAGALPSGRSQFRGKFVNISWVTGNATIENMTFHWTEGESGGFDEEYLELWKYNSSGWVMLNGSADTSANALSIHSHNISSIYAILEGESGTSDITGCQEITANGSYKLTANLEGSPIDASPVGGSACIKIAASDVVLDCDGFNITANESGSTIGIVLNGSIRNVTVKDCIGIGGYGAGIHINDANDSILTNISAFGTPSFSSIWGFYIGGAGSNNTITQCTAHNVTQQGFKIMNSQKNLLQNNLVYDSSVGFSIMGNNNTLRNNSVYRCASGYEMEGIANTTLQDNLAWNLTSQGYWTLGGASGTRFINNTARNTTMGFDISGSGNLVANNTAYENSGYGATGFRAYGSDDIYLNNTAYDNGVYGFHLAYASGINLSANRAFNNSGQGIAVEGVNNTRFSGDRFYNNGMDLLLNATAGMDVYLANVIFDSPPGAFANFTNLSINDTVPASSAYSLSWTSNSSALPSGAASFRGKFVNITPQDGAVSIDSIAWHWTAAEESGYIENFFELYKYNSSGWGLVSSSPDTSNNEFLVTSLEPNSDYGILQSVDVGECMQIDAQGTFQLSGNLIGANISTPELTYYGGNLNTSFACIKIASSNVTLDCNGYSIVNDGTLNASGIAVAGTNTTNYTNVEIRNCPDVSGYANGIMFSYTQQGRIANTSVSDWNSGIVLLYSSHNNVTGNTARDGNDGIAANSYCSYNLFEDNTVYDNVYGIGIWHYSTNNSLVNNTAYGNNWYGFFSYNRCNGTLFENNTAHSGGDGIYSWLNRDDRIINNTAYNNTRGIVIDRSNYCNVTLNTVYGNQYGLMEYFNANHTVFSDMEVFNNSRYGLYVHQTTNLTIRNIHAYGNGNDSTFLDNDDLEPALTTISVFNLTIDSPGGIYQNFTRFNITDTIENDTGYVLTWAAEPPTLPTETISFEGKFVNITRYITGSSFPLSIDEIVWHWDESELAPEYNESGFELWKYNSSGWRMVSGSPDASGNTFTMADFNPLSTYGILNSSRSDCGIIDSAGEYVLRNDLVGAPILVDGIALIDAACMVVSSSDVILDCNGSTITNDGTPSAAGILVNSSGGTYYENVTIRNCPGVSDYYTGFYAHESDSVSIRNCSALGGDYGFRVRFVNLGTSPNGISISDSFANSTTYCFDVYGADGVNLSGLNATDCSSYGFHVYGSNVEASSLDAHECGYGFMLYNPMVSGIAAHDASIVNSEFYGAETGLGIIGGGGMGILSNVSIENVSIHDNSAALDVRESDNVTLTNLTMHSNTYSGAYFYTNERINGSGIVFHDNLLDLWLEQTPESWSSNVSLQALFLSPGGGFVNYTNLTINDVLEDGDAYSLTWSANYSAPPAGWFSFEQKYLDYVPISSGILPLSVDEMVWHWTEDEAASGGYNESRFELWGYGGGWDNLTVSLDTSANTITLLDYADAAVQFGILENNASENCPIITSSGIYSQALDYSGAPNAVDIPSYPSISNACIIIDVSDVIFDCAGHSISHNAPDNTVGVLVNITRSNVTLMNCNVEGYENGIFSVESNNTAFLNNTVFNSSQIGLVVREAYASLIQGNTVYGSGLSGFRFLNLYDSNLSENLAYGNAGEGFYFYDSGNVIMEGNSAQNNSDDGFMLTSENIGNTIRNCTAFNNSGDGFYISGDTRFGRYSSYNQISNNTAWENGISGFRLLGNADNNSISDCTAYGNGEAGYYITNNFGNNLSGGRAYGNALYGAMLVNALSFMLENNTAYLNDYGFWLDQSSGSSVNDSATENANDGFYAYSCTSLNITDALSSGNGGYGAFLEESHGTAIDPSWFCNNGEGILVYASDDVSIEDSVACNNSVIGIRIVDSNNTLISGSRTFNNSAYDLRIENNLVDEIEYRLSNMTFDSPLGAFSDFTSLNASDLVGESEEYSINWTSNSSALPAGHTSFHGKFINISRQSPNPISIGSMSWTWLEGEASGYDESKLGLWKWNASGWTLLNLTPDISANELSLSDFDPESDYGILSDEAGPEIIWVSQVPPDIDSFNLFTGGANITYNITDPSGIDPNSPFLYYKTNSTASDCWTFVNGSLDLCGYQQRAPASNVSDSWLWRLFDNQVYPATYNFDEREMELTAHGSSTLTTQNDFVKIRMFNVSPSKQYGVFEVMANVSSGTTPLRIYYCNESYATGNPSVSAYCTNFYNLNSTQAFNHSHSAYSSHMTIPFAMNATDGTLGGVKVTGTSYFILRPSMGGSWNYYYITNVSRADTTQITSNNGNAYTNLSGTLDSHLHQYDGSDRLWYYACANDTLGNSNCSESRYDYLNLTGIPPTAPDVFNPSNSTYCGNITINYTAAISPNGYNISYYNISLLNPNFTFNQTINGNNSLNLSYVWDTNGTAPGNYTIQVEACDVLNQCSLGYSEEFNFTGTTCGLGICPIITAPGNYSQDQNYTGAPNDAGEVSLGSVACLKIAASDVLWDCQGYSITNNGTSDAFGIFVNSTHTNVTVQNCPSVAGYYVGAYMFSAQDSTFRNMTVNESDFCFEVFDPSGAGLGGNLIDASTAYNCSNAGFYLQSTNYSNITNSIAYDFGSQGYLVAGSVGYGNAAGNFLANNTARDSVSSGFVLSQYSLRTTLLNNTAFNLSAGGGFAVGSSDLNNFTNNTAYLDYRGFIVSANNNTFIGNDAYNNSDAAFYLSSAYGNNLTGNTAHDNANSAWSGTFFLLFGGNNTFINNSAWNNTLAGFYSNSAEDNLFENNTAWTSQYGFYMVSANRNNLSGNLAYNCSNMGISLAGTNVSSLYNNTVRDSLYGIYLSGANLTTSAFDSAYNNSMYQLTLDSGSTNNTMSYPLLYGGQRGVSLQASDQNSFYGMTVANASIYNFYMSDSNQTYVDGPHFYNSSGWDFYASSAGSARSYDMVKAWFDNPQGGFANFTELYIRDSVDADTAYGIKWTANSSILPFNRISFEQKWVDITTTSLNPVSIDEINWTWTDGEVTAGGYNESKFELWKYNTSEWTKENNTPDTTANTLGLYSMDPASEYGILQYNLSNCPIIGESGEYNQTMNFTGAPNDASEIEAGAYACLKIVVSDVVWDCNGYSIIGDGTLGTEQYGVLLNGSIANITLRNCPSLSNYTDAIRIYDSNDSRITNVSARNNTESGFYIDSSRNASMADNSVYGSGGAGTYVIDSDNTSVTRDHFYANTEDLVANGTSLFQLNLSQVIFDSPPGGFANFTNLSINDLVDGATAYSIKWSANASAIPGTHFSFENKFVNITNLTSGVSVDSLTWHWTAAETAGYNESAFELLRFNETHGWTVQNSSPDTANHELSLSSLDEFSQFGILEYNYSGCVNLSDPLTWGTRLRNISGALYVNENTTLCTDTYYMDANATSLLPLLYMNVSNIFLDCNDSILDGMDYDGKAIQIGYSGMGIDPPAMNDTVMNCYVRNYGYAFVLETTSNDSITNCTAFNNTFNGFGVFLGGNNSMDNTLSLKNQYGYWMMSTSNNSVMDSESSNNTLQGIYEEGSEYGRYSNVSLRFNEHHGLYAYASTYLDIGNCSAVSNQRTGIFLSLGKNPYHSMHNVHDCMVYGNYWYGIHVNGAFSNNLTGNAVHGHELYGIYLVDTMNNTLDGNDAYQNGEGYYLSGSMQNRMADDSAESNTNSGYLLENSPENNLTSCNATGNGGHGLHLIGSNSTRIDPSWFCNNTYGISVNMSNDTVIDDSIMCNNTLYGIYVLDSNNTLINRSSAYGNGYGIFQSNGDYTNITLSNVTNNTNDGIRFDSGSDTNTLYSSFVCFNGLDVNNQGVSDAGTSDSCDSFINWAENGHFGCEYSCSSMWHRFFGNANGSIVLRDNSSSNLFFGWNASGFNVYFADYDSDVSWYDLRAAGRDASNASSANDFTELDTAFNTTLYGDNINLTYSSDGSAPIETATFQVYGVSIPNVPVANSTNFNTSFDTGILWDASDDTGDGQYDATDKETTVWVVAVNSSTADVYGTYDYLIQVPYTLSTYEGSNDLVSIYLELR